MSQHLCEAAEEDHTMC